jgi:hypothetical protein
MDKLNLIFFPYFIKTNYLLYLKSDQKHLFFSNEIRFLKIGGS